ncbi:MAG TPA: ABC transporter permease [Thermoleophilaceae bacterium]|nr:ABC transporter permease [Thermoleophilaceae bacterium]
MSPRYRSVVLGVARRNVHTFFTNPALIVPALMFPLFFFVAFAGGLSRISGVPGFDFPSGYTAFQFVFVLLQSSAFGGVFTGFGMAQDFERGFGRRMMLAAPRRSAVLAGYALSGLVRAATVQVMLFAIALAAGMQVGGGGVDIFGLVLLALIVNVAAGMWAAGIALRFRSIQASPLMQTPVFLILFLAPVYVPIELLHGWIHGVATVNPVTALLDAGRGFIAGSPTKVALAFALALALSAAFLLWAVRGLRRAESAA